MRTQPVSSSHVAWTTFRRGDLVHACTEQGDAALPLTVMGVDNGCVQTEDGRRWLQGTGQQVVCVLQGKPQVAEHAWIAPTAANDPTVHAPRRTFSA